MFIRLKNMMLSWNHVGAKRYYFILITVFVTSIIILSQYSLNSTNDNQVYYSMFNNVINDDDCEIPKLNPYDETIKKYIKKVNPLECKKLQPELTKLISEHVIFDINVINDEKLDINKLKCQYRCIKRKNNDDNELEYTKYKNLINNTKILCEFIEVICYYGISKISIYHNIHLQIIINNDIKADKNYVNKPNVILFVIDSISQSNFKRNLNSTLNVLKTEYNSIIFEGFNKIGDNSFPNALAFLTGIRSMIYDYNDEKTPLNGYFDDYPIIWNDYKSLNYSTYYAEDYPNYNLFNYLNNGFIKQPTIHYLRPYWLQVYGSFLHRRSTHLCYGNNKLHNLQLNYLKEFIVKYSNKNVSIFALNWLTELGHDYLNQVNIGDNDISHFFKNIKKYLKNTFLFVLSDHGHRFDPIRQSIIGRIEERMPFFSISLPENLTNEKLIKILNENSKKLTSFWDLYVTLRDIYQSIKYNELDTFNPDEIFIDKEKIHKRGLSLLRKLPKKRNCLTANISEDFCICQRESEININDTNVINSANTIILHINNLLKYYINDNLCVKLYLDKIINAQTFLPNIKIAYNSNGFYVMYRVSLIVKPSNAFLEGIVKHFINTQTYNVVGDINRINQYGNQSICVKTQQLRKYCYCIQNIQN